MKLLLSSAVTSVLILFAAAPYCSEFSKGNTTIDSFNKAKKYLERQVVFDHRTTIYCQAEFDAHKNITLPPGFTTQVHKKRTRRIEWEHVVPAENFGRAFSEWREGSPECVDNRGKLFKGRKCAEKANMTFRYMQSDMYNLYPAIGAVNAERGNKNFVPLSSFVPSTFGSCAMKIQGNKAEPPAQSRGVIARTYKYMAYAYDPIFKLSLEQTKIMNAWDKQYPVQAWECSRAKRIERIQGNENPFVKIPCKSAGMW